jgi:carbonic anhydrase/acetyltransferase-like protein (isoleucine patch superfamily)
MFRLIRALEFRLNRALSSARGAKAGLSGVAVGHGVELAPATEVYLGNASERRGQIKLGHRTRVDRGAILRPYGGSIETGIDVYIGPYTVIYGHGGVVIGKDTLMSMHCRILSSNHTIPPPGTIIRSQPDVLKPTRIGADVWLGAGVTVLGGVTIGEGCVVGAGAVVAHDLPPYSIAVGVPAKITGFRR